MNRILFSWNAATTTLLKSFNTEEILIDQFFLKLLFFRIAIYASYDIYNEVN
jgi:hypothetical protein